MQMRMRTVKVTASSINYFTLIEAQREVFNIEWINVLTSTILTRGWSHWGVTEVFCVRMMWVWWEIWETLDLVDATTLASGSFISGTFSPGDPYLSAHTHKLARISKHISAHAHQQSLFFCDTHTLSSISNCLPKHNGPAALTTQLEESLTFDPWGQLINTNTPPWDANDQLMNNMTHRLYEWLIRRCHFLFHNI